MQVRFIFKAEGKDYTLTYSQSLTLELLIEWISAERKKLEAEFHIQNLKAFVQKDVPHQAHHQYIKVQNTEFLQAHLADVSDKITVEYFFPTRKQSVATSLNRIGVDLESRESELKMMVNELKDEASQFYAIEIISKTSRSYSADVEHIIDIFLVVSDPLAYIRNSETHPIYNDEVNITSHIERLKRSSVSDCNLTIRARREWGTRKKLVSILSQQEVSRRKINIVQLLTEVRTINGKLMISLEGPLGEQMWEPAEQILSYHEIDLLIIIGVGANLLQAIDYPKPLILITSISIEEKRMITQNRNKLDSENIYNDALAQVFLESFYQNLFKRIEIGLSVQLAKEEAKKLSESCIWCCCLHQHAAGCRWEEIISKIGYMQAHRLFKHKEYKTNNYYQTTSDIQEFLLNTSDTCCASNICCYNRLGVDKKVLHGQVEKILLWNNKCSEVLYSNFEENQKRLNKFQSEEYDNPTGRKRPFTIYKLLQAIVKKNDKVLIIRSPTLSLAKRYLSFAKEYLQTRDKQAYFCEYAISKEGIKKNLKDVLSVLKSKMKLGTGTTPKINLYIQTSYDPSKPDKYYLKLFKDEPFELIAEANNIGIQIQKIKIILLTCNPNFDDKYPIFKIDEPEKSELFHYHLSKYPYDYIKANLAEIKQQIQKQQTFHNDEVSQKCEDMFYEGGTEYFFLGFISLFSDDGFYLTKYGKIVLEVLFGQETVGKAISHALPIEIINLSDCIYIQLHKSYQVYFLHGTTQQLRREFQQKQMEYYYILFRTYCELFTITDLENCEGTLRLMFKREGLFSINIQDESDAYDERVNKCKQLLQKADNQSSLFDYNSYRHLYHLNQTEKIIQNFMKRKKNQYVATSKSIVRQSEPFHLTYLFWNILHLTWKIVITMSAQYLDKVQHFQDILLIFLIRVEIATPFAEIARLQLYMMIGRIPPKSEELFKYSKDPRQDSIPSVLGSENQGSMVRGRIQSSIIRQVEQSSMVRNQMTGVFKCSKEMSKILLLFRVYSIKQYSLSQLEINWGQMLKFQEEVSACIKIAEKIIELIQSQNEEFKDELEYHKMFKNFSILEWNKEILKFTERKISYYFQLTKMLKYMQARDVRNSRQKQFHKQFKLINLVHDFRSQRAKLPQNERNLKHRLLIDHYLKVLMNESEVSPAIIEEMKGQISAEYLPIFDHLCQKVEQNTLFNQKGLIICARARTILAQGRPYIMSRKRNLTMNFLKEAIQKLKLKISYFTLNTNTLNNLKSDQNNKRCEVLFLILAIDCPSATQLNFGEDNGINSEIMDVHKFAEQIKACRIHVLIICGKNSIRMCEELTALLQGWEYFPNIIAVQSNRYSINDEPFHAYASGEGRERAWEFLCNEVNQIAFDMLAIAIVANITSRLGHRSHALTEEELDEKITKSLKMVHEVLEEQFQCTGQVINEILFKVWANHRTIDRIPSGVLQDLTAKFYSSEHNLHDENYYENVGRCQQVGRVIDAVVRGQRCIEILGNYSTGKSTLLQEICWISQTKNIFKFGVFLFRLSEDKDTNLVKLEDFFRNREFSTSQNFKTNQTSVLIALDNVDEQFLNNQKQLLKNLRGKAVTIIYSTVRKEWGQELQSILDCKTCLTVNLNKITLDEVYGQLMAHIKLYSAADDHRYTKKVVREFERKVLGMMRVVEKVQNQTKLSKALELLKEISPKKEDDKLTLFLQFYKRNFENLIKQLQNIKEIKVKII